MFLFYSTDVMDDTLMIKGDDHLHCSIVLRKKAGDIIYVTDGKGNTYTSKIISISKTQTECSIEDSKYQIPLSPAISIAISPTKNAARLEWFLEKSTEIGISSIYLVQTQRTEKKTVNLQRLEKVLISAMKQSLNTHLPTLQVSKFKDFMKMELEKYNDMYIAHCENPDLKLKHLYNSNKSSILLIGPEGDFTKEEIANALSNGYQGVSLGDMRLRTETAGLTGLFIMRYPKL